MAFLTQRHRDTEAQSFLGLPAAGAGVRGRELGTGCSKGAPALAARPRRLKPIKSLLPWGLSPRVILTQRHRDTEAQSFLGLPAAGFVLSWGLAPRSL